MRITPYMLVLVDSELRVESSDEFDALASFANSIVIAVEPLSANTGEAYRIKRYDLAVHMPEEAPIIESVVGQIRAGKPGETSYFLDARDSSLRSASGTRLVLSKLEYRLLAQMSRSQERVHSVAQITRLLVGDQGDYKGVPVLVSRLQRKFRTAFSAESLFKSVRNQGYCLVQNIILRDACPTAEGLA